MPQWSSTEAAGRGVTAGDVVELPTLIWLSGGSTELVKEESASV